MTSGVDRIGFPSSRRFAGFPPSLPTEAECGDGGDDDASETFSRLDLRLDPAAIALRWEPTDLADQPALRAVPVLGVELPFDIDLRHVRCFPDTTAPRVLWIGLVRVPAELKRLHTQCASLLHKAGIQPDKEHDFTPHVTLARLTGSPHLPAFARMVANYKHAQCGKCTIHRLLLMESRPQAGGSVYSPYATADLTPPDQEGPAGQL